MGVLGDEQQLCPCYKEYQEFQKLVELKNTGLAVYCHRPRQENIRQGEAVDSVVNTPRDVFILHNKADSTISTSELFSELENKNISCPRCRKLFEHAQKLLQEVKSISRNIVMGICDHCRKKAQSIKMPFCACDEIVKKFISVKGDDEKEYIKKYVKRCLSKMGHILKDDIPLNTTKHFTTPAYSEVHIPQESKKINTTFPSTSLVDSDTTFVKTSVFVKEKQDEVFEDKPKKGEDKKQYAQDQNIVTERDKYKEVNLKKDGLSDKTKKDVKGKPKSKVKGDDKGSKIARSDLKQKEETKREISTEEKSNTEKVSVLQKLLAEHLKEKQEALKKKKGPKSKVQKAKEAAERKEREAAERKEKEAAERESFRPLMKKRNETRVKLSDISISEKILKHKQHLENTEEQKDFGVEVNHQATEEEEQTISQDTKMSQIEIGMKGVIRYVLSDRTFIEKGWTMLPTEKVLRKMNVYRMRPAHPEFNWFEHNKNKQLMTYDTGERLAEFDDNGRGRWYYRNGRLALDYYDAEETNAQQRYVVYSSGEPDERGRTYPITTLATFDYLGNGIVFDHAGKIRLTYNQSEGEVLDRAIGPYSHWQWHSLNDPPVLQKVMIDTQLAHKDPDLLKLESPVETEATRPDDEKMLDIEFKNFMKERSKKLSRTYQPFQIKMKALKINKHFSLRVLDQATVYLTFRDGSTNLKLNIGMKLDHQEIVDIDTAEMGQVSNSLKRFPGRTDSLVGLQHSVARAQHYERQHVERERRLRPPMPCASVEQLTAGISPPMRLPLRTVPTGSSPSTGYSCRKSTNSVCCRTRFRF